MVVRLWLATIATSKYFSSTKKKKKKSSANNLLAANCKLIAKCRINVIYLYCAPENDIEVTAFLMPFVRNYFWPLDFGIARSAKRFFPLRNWVCISLNCYDRTLFANKSCHFDYLLLCFHSIIRLRRWGEVLFMAIDHFSTFCSGHEKRITKWKKNDKKNRKSHMNLPSRTDTRENVMPHRKKQIL